MMNGRPAEQAPSITLGALPPAVSDLIAAVVDALELPLPSLEEADERAYLRIIERRVSDVRVVLATMLDFPDTDIRRDAADIRDRTAAVPAAYAPFEDTTDGGEQ
jgi:hypothetical protein